jgi:uncharacterized repeat protein (TIGR01451 family)
MEFQAESARSTLVGAAVAYRLTVTNNGEASAQNLQVSGLITNADAQQKQTLSFFFNDTTRQPVHTLPALAPGETIELRGELRLSHSAIVPIRVKDRALLIPVVAFNIRYGWAGGGRGRTGSAFIVGQESDPPRERMAPFRLDLGPRQFRSVGSRPAQRALVA